MTFLTVESAYANLNAKRNPSRRAQTDPGRAFHRKSCEAELAQVEIEAYSLLIKAQHVQERIHTMAGPRTSLDATGKKRKQSVDESPAATNQKRLKKEVSNATPVKTGKGVVNAAAISTPATGSAKKDAKKQGDNMSKEQPSLSKNEQKKLKQEAQQTPVSAKTSTPQSTLR